ncbi:uncharacterized protein NFIA_044860 [Aspergillus fischeri NRRL 181]|uniref:CorA-like Mg2+ transporter protein n=1 Tax=Neosartorya fischeri (strain ATCC 1020 / DSM 3700 / CBS 544.65 / FGSC A1164 / JCM 1740 / NRRL 181 / WB 181) TaxID=331117 RepID=A1CV90_NEOFI|nr:uncharacterized protein NFIA_044860 [Aspergillus fischeri NRRL 181]EAW25667.1 hypothetical protein NFIA_044860 [Aspergillus fischeri NRRL 181]KAG2009228.1 hypothetical protein GB937_007824 [Aspergillus fischeri]
MIQKEWQRKWSSLLDEIDNCVRLQVTDLRNRQMREDLMFDSSFARSDFYFTILQHLRIFAQTIRDTGSDLQALADLGLFHLRIPLDNIESPAAAAWEQIMTRFEETSDRLLQRIYNQTEDIRSLRDGLFNATSLREASKSTNMNRYIMVFTIMTILYLPLSFVALALGPT